MRATLRHVLLVPCLLTASLALAAGASRQPQPQSPPPQPAPTGTTGAASPAAPSSLDKMADEVMRDVEKLRGWSFKRPVRRERVGPDAVRQYLQQQIERALPRGRREIAQAFLQASGLVPPGTDLVGSVLKVLDQQVAGYYDPAAGTLYLVDRTTPMPEFMQRAVLAHELTHALDDQHVGLARMVEGGQARTEDEDIVLSSLGEGSATSLMFRYLMQQMAAGAVNALEAGAYFAREVEQARVLEGMPRYFHAMFGSYVIGSTFLARGDLAAVLRLPDNREVGDRFRTAWAAPPRSSEQILHPEKYWERAQQDEPVVFDDAALERWLARPGRQVVHRNTLGELLTAVLTGPANPGKDPQQMLRDAWTNGAAAGWGGDRFYLLAEGDTSEQAARDLRGIKGVWVTAWDTERDRDEFVGALEAGRLPPGAAITKAGPQLALMFVNFDGAERADLSARLAQGPPAMTKAGQAWGR